MSDSEDDFMSDKFLVEAPIASSSRTHSQKRDIELLKNQRKGQLNNKLKLHELERERRKEGLSKSLFDDLHDEKARSSLEPEKNGESSNSTAFKSQIGSIRDGGDGGDTRRSAGGNKALNMMQKMGWKIGESLGKTDTSSSQPTSANSTSDQNNDDDAPRGGIGSSSRNGPSDTRTHRIEPIRISLWQGRKGLSARSPSPPPLPPSTSGQNIDYLDPKKLARLGEETDSFRNYQRKQFGNKKLEGEVFKSREKLIQFDEESGVKFHPLHVSPLDPLGTLPYPLLKLIYPAQALNINPHLTPSPSPSPPPADIPPLPDPTASVRQRPLSKAELTREAMRRDLLSNLNPLSADGGDEDLILSKKRKLGLLDDQNGKEGNGTKVEGEKDYEGVVWEDHVSGTKRVLNMNPEDYLEFLLSQLRNEHLFCLWCGYKYGSYEEMMGQGGCPGEDEDSH